jgi:putative two-component system response regulator
VIPQLSQQIIMEHHECFNGSGFPKAIRGNRLHEESQIVAFADRFSELTSLVAGKPRMTASQAAVELSLLSASDPAKSFIEPSLMKRLISLFPASSSA